MNVSKNSNRLQRARRVRSKISGTSSTPRLSVFRSLRGISVQVIDDEKGNTLASASWKEMKKPFEKNNVKQAMEIGKLIGRRCLEKEISSVVFDRAGYSYHGKVKAVAEGAREAGLNF
jgi:large subunit ribosomal protein L18